jgi:hypothetical protein
MDTPWGLTDGFQGIERLLGDDFAVERLQGIERLLEKQLPLGTDGRLAGTGEAAEQLGRQRRGAGLRQGAAVQRHLAAGVAHRRPQVLPVEAHEALAGQQAQPEEERHLGRSRRSRTICRSRRR